MNPGETLRKLYIIEPLLRVPGGISRTELRQAAGVTTKQLDSLLAALRDLGTKIKSRTGTDVISAHGAQYVLVASLNAASSSGGAPGVSSRPRKRSRSDRAADASRPIGVPGREPLRRKHTRPPAKHR